jgi:uncharacterized protein (TIGR00369 family)
VSIGEASGSNATGAGVDSGTADRHVASLEEVRSYSGLDFLRRIAEGNVAQPPIAATLGFRLSEVAPGLAVFTMTPELRHYNPIGTVHGGVASTLLDSCMSCAVQTHLAKGQGYTTLELKVNLVRPITAATGPIRAEGRSLHVGGAPARPRVSSSMPRAPSWPTAPPPV